MKLEGNIPGGGRVEVEIEADRIAAVHALGTADPSKPYVSPGLVDIQINGLQGLIFRPRLEPEQAVSVLPALFKTGVTTFYPTLITNTREQILRNLRVLEQARQLDTRFARAVPGYHLEGPYLSPGPSHGAHDPSLMKAPDWEEFAAFQRVAGGRIRIVTLAPELPGRLISSAGRGGRASWSRLGTRTARKMISIVPLKRASDSASTWATVAGNSSTATKHPSGPNSPTTVYPRA